MPRYRIVVDDVDRAHEFEKRQYRRAFAEAGTEAHLIERLVSERVKNIRPKGTIHAEMSVECPDGLPNCRKCGDPEFAERCAVAGHCPYCGTRHGIAPDSALAQNGFQLEEV